MKVNEFVTLLVFVFTSLLSYSLHCGTWYSLCVFVAVHSNV